MEKLFVRTTLDGIAIRVYRSDKSAMLNVELSTDAAVTYAQDGLASDPIGIEMYSAGAFGVREQSPSAMGHGAAGAGHCERARALR